MIPISTKFSGVKASLMNREAFKEFLIQSLFDEEKFRIIMLDEKKLYQSMVDKEFRTIVNQSEIVLCSSRTIAWMAKTLVDKELEVIMPVTLFLDIMRAADEMNYTAFLFGGKKDVNIETLKRVKKSFGNARIVGNFHQNIKGDDLEDVLVAIRKSSPQVFFVNLGGGKKQEKWISQYQSYFPRSIIVGVDNSFKIIAGKKKLAPIWFQERGLNGLHSALIHPFNFPRYFRITVLFFSTVYKKIFKKEP